MKKKFTTLVLDGAFGQYELEGEIVGGKKHGYNLSSGAWALYKLHPSDEPAEFLIFRRKGRRKLFAIDKKGVLKIIKD